MEFTQRDELVAWLRRKFDGVGIRGVEMICVPADPGHTICFIDSDADTVHRLRERVGGHVFGYSALTLHLSLAADFSCPRLYNGSPALSGQCSCFPSWHPPDDPSRG